MDLSETPEEQAFRARLRERLASSIPENLRNSRVFADRLAADRILAEAGYIGFSWPTEFGGGGASPAFAAILDHERALIGIPPSTSPSRFGANMLAPTLMRHGSAAQQAELLPPILKVQEIWCQGFSEPEAGSDLANVRCRAVPDGDDLIVTGSKIWTTQAREADWCFALVRTDTEASRHHNLSFVLISMRQPGIEIRPIVQLTGDADFTQLFFSEARVHARHVVGSRGDGWQVAMTTLSAERAYSQLGRYVQYQAQLDRIGAALREAGRDRARDGWLEELGRLQARISGIRNLSFKLSSLANAGEDFGTLASVTKLWWSSSHQQLVDFGYRVSVGLNRDEDYWYRLWLLSRAETIYAGTSQIQRNIIGERGLGLPR
jgi:alkylation response protein AidB-like acyl-CoA dehydrogenase